MSQALVTFFSINVVEVASGRNFVSVHRGSLLLSIGHEYVSSRGAPWPSVGVVFVTPVVPTWVMTLVGIPFADRICNLDVI